MTKVNPAYTSQQCNKCYYTNKNNRKTRDKFECGCCGNSGHADVIASRNISSRSSTEFLKLNKSKIFLKLNQLNLTWKEQCGYSSTEDYENATAFS